MRPIRLQHDPENLQIFRTKSYGKSRRMRAFRFQPNRKRSSDPAKRVVAERKIIAAERQGEGAGWHIGFATRHPELERKQIGPRSVTSKLCRNRVAIGDR
jgi:hypothetical protein